MNERIRAVVRPPKGIAAGALAILLGVAVWLAADLWGTSTREGTALRVREFHLRGWTEGSYLEVRRGGNQILLRRSPRPQIVPGAPLDREIWSLDLNALELSPAAPEAWNHASGTPQNCEVAGVPDFRRLRFDPGSGEAQVEGRALSTVGRIKSLRVDASGKLLAVLSVWGLPVPGVAPGLLDSDSHIGWRYLEIFTSSGDRIAVPVGLGFGSEDGIPCWLPDTAALAYANWHFTRLTIVQVPAAGEQR